MAENTKLVTVSPDDSIDTIIAAVRQAGASHVELLVPNGSPALQSRKACDKLRETTQRANIELTLYAADEKVIRSAQTCQIMTVPVDPIALGAMAEPAPAPTRTPTSPRAQEEDAFLRSLEEVPAAPTARPAPPPSAAEEEDPWASALDSLAVASTSGASALRDHEQSKGSDADWFDAFNDFSDTVSGDAPASSAPPRQRIRAEDIELSSEDMDRQMPRAKRQALEEKAAKKGGKAKAGGKTKPKGKRKPAPALPLMPIALGLLALLLIGALIWFFFLRAPAATIVVGPPATGAGQELYEEVRVNFQAEPVTDQTSGAVQGRMIEATANVAIPGQVSEATLQPDQAAAGTVQLYNGNSQAYLIPAGTSFFTTGTSGEQLRFVSTQDVSVPAATTSFASTTAGFATVPVVASAGGDLYNLPARPDQAAWAIEGFDPIIGVNGEAITGGTVIEAKIPTEADVQALLSAALPQLTNQAITQLQGQLQPGEVLAGIGLTPALDQLASNPELYTYETRPIPGSDGGFELVVSSLFRGLAVPADNPLPAQVDRALPNALKIHGFDPNISQVISYSLTMYPEGQANILLAEVETGPREQDDDLPAALQGEIASRIAGKSIDEAQLILSEYVQRGQIGPVIQWPAVELLPADPTSISIEVQR